MDWYLIGQKLESLRRCVRRVEEKCPQEMASLFEVFDAQDILALNLTRAVQLCVDIGAHLVADTQLPPPDSISQTFDILQEAGIISVELSGRMKKAVGFPNLAVPNYDAINWAIVYAIARYRMTDFEDFARAVVIASQQGL